MEFIGITMGDPAGVGPEIILKALNKKEEYRKNSIVFGSKKVLDYYKKLLNIKCKLNIITSIEEFREEDINIVNTFDISMEDFKIGKVSKICGHAAYEYIKNSINWALQNKIKSVVTAPLNKEALHLGGHNFQGHTEIFATLTNTKRYAMMLWSEPLKVIHVSTHISLKEACEKLNKERIIEVIKLADENLKDMGINNPKIAVAGLNPHSGEAGIFGDEEIKKIYPAIQEAKKSNIDVDGPVPPDTVFLKAFKGEYDIVVAMYHDQGHIPIKLLAFDLGVNVTVGLPIVRTSVDHGTAFDIAGKGSAKEKSLLNALEVAKMFK
ncbi:4-hydroxythreonine-4-phosphate dehydrogenase PdxA [Clostridium rectalis]|uniref:4-hydroxythreonine-4-phosphate dehydrogenase PdxA n=1 Tax=Clostridium rectalis TaxID=2040295 RepID=UPI000F633121|nr:4-hydroxythreonine-4-phosphate dehydrogenase PdxA [Clostridium rectalis]